MTEKQKNILRQIISIIANDGMRPVKLIAIAVGIFAGLGFAFKPDEREIYFLISIMPMFMWSATFLTVSAERLIRMFTRFQHKVLIYSESAFSVWLWVMLFSSGVMAGERGMMLLYLLPVLIEVWLLIRSIFDYDMSDINNRRRRKTDSKVTT